MFELVEEIHYMSIGQLTVLQLLIFSTFYIYLQHVKQ